jgi:predicted metal-dependent hydrolase
MITAAAPQLAQLALTMDCRYARLQVRQQRTRWGSCSTRGTISLNCCLLFQRPEVFRYLLVHELSHLRHMHHGPRFWAHVARFAPDCRELDRELGKGWLRVPQWALRDRE